METFPSFLDPIPSSYPSEEDDDPMSSYVSEASVDPPSDPISPIGGTSPPSIGGTSPSIGGTSPPIGGTSPPIGGTSPPSIGGVTGGVTGSGAGSTTGSGVSVDFAFGNFSLTVSGNIILGSGTTYTRGTGTMISNGNPSLTSNSKIFNIPLVFQTAGRTLTFIDNWILSSSLTITGTLASPISARTQTLGVQRKLTLPQNTGSADIDYCVARDLDSGDGTTIWNYKGTQTNCVNWLDLPTRPPTIFGNI